MQKLIDHQEFGGMRIAVVAHGVPGRLGRDAMFGKNSAATRENYD
jgi:hypothetical protein